MMVFFRIVNVTHHGISSLRSLSLCLSFVYISVLQNDLRKLSESSETERQRTETELKQLLKRLTVLSLCAYRFI